MLSGDLRKVSGENIEIRTIPVENANIIKNVHPQSTQVIRRRRCSPGKLYRVEEIINDTKRSRGRSNTRG